ncbi:gas vesicle protein [Streptomyces fumanus]|uniref:Gas vesicle protein n=1 Tax=Streptomyces fumanus TaxID=67302 RepID=A0A919AT32_9ACTN|nr:gas vesicle protein [Streptomyces fumanus]GHF25643.1 gas vesicle protein [Streptomyces fumanus]
MTNTKNTSDSQSRQRSSRTAQDSHESADDRESTDDTSKTSETKKTSDTSDTSDTAADRRPSAMQVLRQARDQLAELTGMVAESVSSFAQTEDGWALEVEVLELERVPDTMSLMGSYQVELDHQGQLTGYRRVRRYERGRADGRRSGGQ